jgi:monoterpene epsilon-lactone hydrolase
MAPQQKQPPYYQSSFISNDKTRVLFTADGAPYVICDSDEAFQNPTTPKETTPELANAQLNLNLGQTFISRGESNSSILLFIKLLDLVFVQWWDGWLCALYARFVPLSVRRCIVFAAWCTYRAVHAYTLGRTTGLHASQSLDYHALTTALWWSRFVPVPPRRMRFSLSQLNACTPNVVESAVTTVRHEMILTDGVPLTQTDHCVVTGLYLHSGDGAANVSAANTNSKTIFWIYGGAYLAGDAVGNSSAADWIGRRANKHVFVPTIRLAPEANLDDVLWDACLAYKYLCQSVDPNNIVVLGISSGAAIAVRLLQLIAEQKRNEELMPSYLSTVVKGLKMPQSAVLFGPYIDYTMPKKGSFLHYAKHDLIVNEAVQDYGLPYLEKFIPNGRRREYSPVYRSMQGLPPLCVVVSEHECVYDMTIELVNQARQAGVPVTVGVWKYMCHVFSLLWAFCPEGALSMEFVCDWIRAQESTDARACE